MRVYGYFWDGINPEALLNHALQSLDIKAWRFIKFNVTPKVTPIKSVLPLVSRKKAVWLAAIGDWLIPQDQAVARWGFCFLHSYRTALAFL
jgi:hypothetical protein